MRTFRFIVAGAANDQEQEQTVSCNLYLEPIADVPSTQPDDCTCHTVADCAIPGSLGIRSTSKDRLKCLFCQFEYRSFIYPQCTLKGVILDFGQKRPVLENLQIFNK